MSTLCSQADSCSLGAKRPALFSTLVVTEISLWTLTQPMCTCSCVWVCVHGCVCVCTCAFCTVTHVVEVERFSSSRGCLFFCWWLKPLAGERKAVSTVWNVGERQLCHKSSVPRWSSSVIPSTWHPPPPPQQSCHLILLSDVLDIISTRILPVRPQFSHWWPLSKLTGWKASISWKGRDRKLTGWI